MSVTIYTDGSAVPNPGDGGWGVAMYYNGTRKTYCGFVPEKTTNNKIELLAVTKAVMKAEKRHKNKDVCIYTDSKYVKDGMMSKDGALCGGWIKKWKQNNWLNAKKEDVKNKPEWKALYEVVQNTRNTYTIEWVKAHSTNKRNNLADKLANMGREQKNENV
jgi:ribonuclease HI